MNIFTQISNMQYEGMGLHYSQSDRTKMHEEKEYTVESVEQKRK